MNLKEDTIYEVTGTVEEQKAIMEHNERAKVLLAERREHEMLNAPGIADKFRAGIAKVKMLFTRKKAMTQARQNNNQSTR